MTTTTSLVDINTILAQARGKAAAAGRQLDPVYTWTAEAMADNLLDNEEQVFTARTLGRITYLVTEDIAEKLAIFIQDFTTPADTHRSAS